MISVDTNILIYAANPSSIQHEKALKFMRNIGSEELVISELVLVELYMALRNLAIFPKPYSASQAASYCQKRKTNRKWRYVDYEPEVSPHLWEWAKNTQRGFRQTIDARIALTLKYHGVTQLATANTKDFVEFGFAKVWDPSHPDAT